MSGNERKRRISVVVPVLALLALTTSATAATAPPVAEVGGPFPAFTFSPSFSPRVLSKTKPSPIELGLLSRFSSTDVYSFPPALGQLKLLLDRHLELSTRGLPACSPRLQVTPPKPMSVPERCKSALVGNGKTKLIFAYPESKALPLEANVSLLNGGTRGLITKLWIYIPIPVPIPSAILAPVEVRKIDQGRYGTEAIVSVPKVAEGYGVFEQLSLEINREYLFKGERRSVATFRCANGKFQASGEATFLDGTHATDPGVVRTCAVDHRAQPDDSGGDGTVGRHLGGTPDSRSNFWPAAPGLLAEDELLQQSPDDQRLNR